MGILSSRQAGGCLCVCGNYFASALKHGNYERIYKKTLTAVETETRRALVHVPEAYSCHPNVTDPAASGSNAATAKRRTRTEWRQLYMLQSWLLLTKVNMQLILPLRAQKSYRK